MDLISKLISSFDPAAPNFRPTEIYNESWLVKLVVQQASMVDTNNFLLHFQNDSTWFSEALLPSVFKARHKGDNLAESRTNADCVVGHISIGKEGKADLELMENPSQFTVIEAKINSPLSKGIRNAPNYDQAARSVACMAEVIAQTKVYPSSFEKLDFIFLAPEASIEKGVFSKLMAFSSIRSKVEQRISAYEMENGSYLDIWYEEYFEPTMECIELHCLSWEEIIEWISREKPDEAEELSEFYAHCLNFN